MDLSVEQAAQRLRVDESRVRRLLREGRLAGHRFGGSWVVDGDDVARLESLSPRVVSRGPSGAPCPPSAPGVCSSCSTGDARRGCRRLRVARSAHRRARSRALMPHAGAPLCTPGPTFGASPRIPPPSAGSRQSRESSSPGPAKRLHGGLTLSRWAPSPSSTCAATPGRSLVVRYALDERSSRPSLMVRVPRGGWWPADGELSVPVLAADLLEHAEPRAVNAAARVLNDRASALLGASANQRPNGDDR